MKVRPVTMHITVQSEQRVTTLEVLHHAREARTLPQNYVTLFTPSLRVYMVNGPEAAPSTMTAPNAQPTFNYGADRPFTRE